MKAFLSSAIALAACLAGTLHAEMNRGVDHVVIDGIKLPFGIDVEVIGPWRSAGHFTYAAAALTGLRINGRANDDNIHVELFASKASGWTFEKLSRLKRQAYYRVRGRLTDAYAGPAKKFNVIVEKLDLIDAAPLTVADFADRDTTFEGVAIPGARLSIENDYAVVAGLEAWPAGIEGKRVAVRGTVRRKSEEWHIEDPHWRLLELADQLDQTVSLEGRLVSLNWEWWFEYRKQKVCLAAATGQTMTFPPDDHCRQVRVTGKLVRQDRPSLEQISLKSDRDLVPTFVVRGAEINYLERPPGADRVLQLLYRLPIRVKDGLPELVAESSYRINLVGNETTARLYAERNHDVIVHIVRNATPESRDVVARRMADEEIVRPLRLLYASILACANDQRGRDFLLDSLADRQASSFLDALYCAGIFVWLRQEELDRSNVPTQLVWLEKPLIAIMLDESLLAMKREHVENGEQKLTVADAAVRYSEIPSVLTAINTASARTAILKYIAANFGLGARARQDGELSSPGPNEQLVSNIIEALCGSHNLLPVDDLLRLEPLTGGTSTLLGHNRRLVLVQLLRHKHPAAAERFLKDLDDDFTYGEFVRHLSPEVVAALRPHIRNLRGKAKAHAMMLDVLAYEDPVPRLLELLDGDRWSDKALVFHELARLGDPRAVLPIAAILCDAARDYFAAYDRDLNGKLTRKFAVENALDAIAKPNTGESVGELVRLLRVDLSRFDTGYSRQSWQRIVAAHLIDITGESFGVDVDKWQSWFDNHRRVKDD